MSLNVGVIASLTSLSSGIPPGELTNPDVTIRKLKLLERDDDVIRGHCVWEGEALSEPAYAGEVGADVPGTRVTA
jgi:hypothetical protein